MMDKKFIKSYALMRKSMTGVTNKIMWTAGEMDRMSFIECWLVDGKGIIIYQILPEGAGFNEYVVLTQSEKNVSKLLMTINQLNSAIKQHPDFKEGFVFVDVVALADEVIEETTGVKPKPH